MPKAKKDVYYIEVVGRALDVLEVFVHEQKAQLTLKEIATRLEQNTNTVFRLLYTLARHGYIIKSSKKYELGSKLLDLTNAKLRHTDLVAVAGPYMEALRERFRETVNLGILTEGKIRYIEVRESLERFRLAETVGGSDPLHCTALGKAHLAYLPFPEVRRLMREYGMQRWTTRTITSLAALKNELEKTRERGFAIDREESMLGAFCIAVPILDDSEQPVAAMSIAGPLVRFNENHLKSASDALREAVAAVEAKLRATGKPTAPRHPVLSENLLSGSLNLTDTNLI
ncbi:MAG TPA: IclR family transcriptional regulator [Chthoniobacteraceae bacterium]|jgi:IclR family acetate operon transcriptional repressor|nr:IclR family transcriptional regulator [Chthoniobacteraceae bacterium]